MSSPGKKWSSRFGAAVRRSSSLLAISRPGTPSEADRESIRGSSDRASIHKSDQGSVDRLEAISPLITPPPAPSHPSPIAESPAREAAANDEIPAPIGPSPLSLGTGVVTASVEDLNTNTNTNAETNTNTKTAEPLKPTSPATPPEVLSPAGYVPPPVINTLAGNPGAFTDDPDQLPPTGPVQDPYAPSIRTRASSTKAASVLENPHPEPEPEAMKQEERVVVDEPEPLVATRPSTPPVVPSIPTAPSTPPPASIRAKTPEPEPAHVEEPVVLVQDTRERSRDFAETVHHNTSLGSHATPVPPPGPMAGPPSIPDMDHGEAAEFYRGTPANNDSATNVNANANVGKEPSIKAPSIAGVSIKAPASKAPSIAGPKDKTDVVIIPDWAEPQRKEPEHSYSLPAYSTSVVGGPGQEVWGGNPSGDFKGEREREGGEFPFGGGVGMPVPAPASHDQNGNGNSNGHHVLDDPFVDPPKVVMHAYVPLCLPFFASSSNSNVASFLSSPRLVYARIDRPEAVRMPHEDTSNGHAGVGIVMPLPPREEVIAASSMHRMPSDQGSYVFKPTPTRADDFNERQPLLSKPQDTRSYGAPASSSQSQNNIYVSPLEPNANGHQGWNPVSGSQRQPQPFSHLRLHELGWLEYHLPDGTVYYVHPTRRVTTECNLRSERVLDQVEAFLDERGDASARGNQGVEVWVRDMGPGSDGKSGGKTRKGKAQAQFVGGMFWVDHNARSIVPDQASAVAKGKKGKGVNGGVEEEDQLDCEYRYWSFVEAHPAHNPLSGKAKAEALDVLNWAWTDRLLPSSNAVPPPFAQEECQELMALLRSFAPDRSTNSSDPKGENENGIQNRIVARILIRVAQWRQAYFRPSKPLPKDVASSSASVSPYRYTPQRRTVTRAVVDFLISCVCLGIPYIFLERTRQARMVDEESGLRHAASPFIVIGACTCLVAAIVLSASVTFLSLPGLDGVSRIAGIVAIVLATFSLAATVVAIFRYKNDMERSVGHIAANGLVMITRRSVILALPLVFLVYAIIGFITGIVLYSLRGQGHTVGGTGAGAVVKTVFGSSYTVGEYTRWSIIGVVGALAGMFTTSMLLLR